MVNSEKHIGSISYYNERNRLFRLRNADANHPYYVFIGSKYARRFKLIIKRKLSNKGQHWVDAVFVALQLDLERELSANGKLEDNYIRFHHFILKSHFRVYLRYGFFQLPLLDQFTIIKNIEWMEILFPDWLFVSKKM